MIVMGNLVSAGPIPTFHTEIECVWADSGILQRVVHWWNVQYYSFLPITIKLASLIENCVLLRQGGEVPVYSA